MGTDCAVEKEFTRPISKRASAQYLTNYITEKPITRRFERGSTAKFTFNDLDVGELMYILVEVRMTGNCYNVI